MNEDSNWTLRGLARYLTELSDAHPYEVEVWIDVHSLPGGSVYGCDIDGITVSDENNGHRLTINVYAP